MSDYDNELADLSEAYDEMQTRKTLVKAEVRARYKRLMQEAMDREILDLEREFARKLVRAKEAGLPRWIISKAIRTTDGGKFRHFVALGGGTMRKIVDPGAVETPTDDELTEKVAAAVTVPGLELISDAATAENRFKFRGLTGEVVSHPQHLRLFFEADDREAQQQFYDDRPNVVRELEPLLPFVFPKEA